MAGRPQRKVPPKRERPGPAQAPRKRPLVGVLDSAPMARRQGHPVTGALVQPQAPHAIPAVRLSVSYARAMDASVSLNEASDPDAVVASLARASADRNGGRVRLDDLIAASMVGRVINRPGRDGVPAAKELADRTEGPVVQRTEVASVRYVVSVTPGGGIDQAPQVGQPLTLQEWEGQVRGAEAKALAPVPVEAPR